MTTTDNKPEVIYLTSGYARNSKTAQEAKPYRYLTFEECQALQYGMHVDFIDNRGQVRQAKVNGAVKTWKTRPGDLLIPMKYGLMECFYVTWRNTQPLSINGLRLVKRIEEETVTP